MKRLAILLCSGFVVVAGSALARPVRIWTPEELYDKAELVIIGVVSEVAATGGSSTIQLGGNSSVVVKIERAGVRAVAVIKGEAPRALTFEYAPVDPGQAMALVNGPMRIHLQKDSSYIMYLKKKSDEDVYVGALSGDFDDGMAVKKLDLKARSLR